jgi:hypothetical protein
MIFYREKLHFGFKFGIKIGLLLNKKNFKQGYGYIGKNEYDKKYSPNLDVNAKIGDAHYEYAPSLDDCKLNLKIITMDRVNKVLEIDISASMVTQNAKGKWIPKDFSKSTYTITGDDYITLEKLLSTKNIYPNEEEKVDKIPEITMKYTPKEYVQRLNKSLQTIGFGKIKFKIDNTSVSNDKSTNITTILSNRSMAISMQSESKTDKILGFNFIFAGADMQNKMDDAMIVTVALVMAIENPTMKDKTKRGSIVKKLFKEDGNLILEKEKVYFETSVSEVTGLNILVMPSKQ